MTASDPGPTRRARPLLLGLGWDKSGGLNRYLRGLRDSLEAAGTPTRAVVLAPATDPPKITVAYCGRSRL